MIGPARAPVPPEYVSWDTRVQEAVHRFGWFRPPELLTGSAVNFGSDSRELFGGVVGQVAALRKALAEQAVGALVAAALGAGTG